MWRAGVKSPAFSFILICLFMLLAHFTVGQNKVLIDYESALKIVESEDVSDAVVAIIDGGVMSSHPDIVGSIWQNQDEIVNNIDDDGNGLIDDVIGWNFNNNTDDISIGGLGNWHGTPVNGIINSLTNGSGYVTTMLLNVVKGEKISSVVESLNYLYHERKKYNESNGKEGAFIVAVNCSWGKDSLWAFDYPEWCSLYDSLGHEGVLVVSSVPNSNINIDEFGDMPSTCGSDYLITVTNTNKNDEKVGEAGYGKETVDIAAPGENSYTLLNTGRYGYFGGTSAAAPYVTSAIRLLYSLPSKGFHDDVQKKPDKVAGLIKRCIMEGSDKIASLKEITVSGGRLNVFNSIKLLCDYYGEQYLYKDIFKPLEIVSVYPNPATTSTTLVVESDQFKSATIGLVDSNGRYVKSFGTELSDGINSISIDFNETPKGFYVLRIASGSSLKTRKVFIQ